ncbi:O-methyltransferase-domain-containing protein [Abortiporus biennis]|nr:O-methyltransferase-domain-containing protein [Abortiporus biennis]
MSPLSDPYKTAPRQSSPLVPRYSHSDEGPTSIESILSPTSFLSSPKANAIGQPGDTPLDRISYALHQIELSLTSDSSSPDIPTALSHLKTARRIAQHYDTYAAEVSEQPPIIVERMVEEGDNVDWEKLHNDGETIFRLIPEMSAGGYEGVVLRHLCRASKAKTILEVGMFMGTTTISLALLPSVTKVVALEIEPYLEKIVQPYFAEAGVEHKVEVMIGDALGSLDKLIDSKANFDMIFIDADKSSYKTYFQKIMSSSPSLLAKGGMIIVDNTAFKAAPWVPDENHYEMGREIKKFNELVRMNDEVDAVMLTIEDGITLIRRKDE